MVLLISSPRKDADLRIRVGGSSFGNQREFGSLYVALKAREGRGSCGPSIRLSELARFTNDLERMHSGVADATVRSALLWSCDGDFFLSLSMGVRGNVEVRATICQHTFFWRRAWLHARIEIDQTYIPKLVREFEALEQACSLIYDD